MFLSLVQHLELAAKLKDGLLGAILLRLAAAAEPAQTPAAHVGVALDVSISSGLIAPCSRGLR